MTKPTFEDALTFLESQDIKLFAYQKEMLKLFWENKDSYFIPYSYCGRRFNFMNTKEKENENN